LKVNFDFSKELATVKIILTYNNRVRERMDVWGPAMAGPNEIEPV
jgi:hypothetical protein